MMIFKINFKLIIHILFKTWFYFLLLIYESMAAEFALSPGQLGTGIITYATSKRDKLF